MAIPGQEAGTKVHLFLFFFSFAVGVSACSSSIPSLPSRHSTLWQALSREPTPSGLPARNLGVPLYCRICLSFLFQSWVRCACTVGIPAGYFPVTRQGKALLRSAIASSV